MQRLSLSYLIQRITQPATRAHAIHRVRRRMQGTRTNVSGHERELARRMRDTRREILEAMGEVEACKTCNARRGEAREEWAGGHCCGGECEKLFTPEEVASLVLAGSKPRRLRPPSGDVEHLGCAFRGHTGCTLAVEERPNVCVRYLCRDLKKELALRGDLADIEALNAVLKQDFDVFSTLFHEGEERAQFEAWRRALDPNA